MHNSRAASFLRRETRAGCFQVYTYTLLLCSSRAALLITKAIAAAIATGKKCMWTWKQGLRPLRITPSK